MSYCPLCKHEMLDIVACKNRAYIIDGKQVRALSFGNDWKGTDRDKNRARRCHDCYAPLGFHHHPGCDMEQCPVCYKQLISCEHGAAAVNNTVILK